jgi:glycosyltransferase involved in cell wall biosynthesis
MKIGIAGPIDLKLLNFQFKEYEIPARILTFPLMSGIVNSLMELGHEIIVYTYALDIDEPIVIRKEKLTICIARRKPSPGRRFFKSEINNLTELMIKYPADLINAQWTYEYALAAINSGIPNVITIRDHALTILKYQPDPFRLVRLLLNYRTLQKGRFFIANSDYLKEVINTRKFIKVIPNFYENDLESYYEHKKTNNFKIISVSNGFGRRKNITTALHAFQIIRNKYPESEFHLIGQGLAIGCGANRYASKHELTDGVCFRGPMKFKEVLKEIQSSRIYLHPSKEETFGNTVLEAMVVGTPVVGGRNSGNIPYLLNHGSAGILTDVKDPVSMANGVIQLISNQKIYYQIRKNARKFASENYSKDKVMAKLVDTYAEVLNY